jgi:hypothetical protein
LKNNRKNKVRDFIFADNHLLDKYVEQVRATFAEIDIKSWKMGVSLTGPVVETSRTKERIPLKTHEKIDLIEAFLETQNDLLKKRPATIVELDHKDAPRFVLESMLATKVTLPLSATEAVKGLSSASIWVSDPDPALYVNDPFDWRGTFLYLSELHWDSGSSTPFLSGISALQVIVNLSRGKDFFDYIKDEFEPFGRGRDLHPVDKLKEIGGVVMDRRKIRSLYRIRYFTNEQTYSYEGQRRRVNDLLGYPVYILSES